MTTENGISNILITSIFTIFDSLYTIYSYLLYGTILLLYSYKSTPEIEEIHEDIISSSNTFCKNIVYDIGWKYCELQSNINMVYKKTIIPTFHKITDYKFRSEVFLIKDGKEIESFRNWDELCEYSNENDYEYDFILYTKFDLEDNKKNYTRIIDDKNIKLNEVSSNLFDLKSSVNFILFQIIIDDIKYDISLKDPKNFVLQNNVLKYPFFKWYMNKIYDIELDEDYRVYYMTDDLSTCELYSPFFIRFCEDSMTCFSTGKPKLPIIAKDESENEDEVDETDDTNTDECIDTCDTDDMDSIDTGETDDMDESEYSDEEIKIITKTIEESIITNLINNEKLKCRR
jgi:hypothetical protein